MRHRPRRPTRPASRLFRRRSYRSPSGPNRPRSRQRPSRSVSQPRRPKEPRRNRTALRWHRKLAAGARIAGFVLGGLCLVLGITGMMVLALRGRALLLPAFGVFLGMLVLAITLALGGLMARHVLLILADLGEVARRQQQLLDEINDRLD